MKDELKEKIGFGMNLIVNDLRGWMVKNRVDWKDLDTKRLAKQLAKLVYMTKHGS